MRVPVWLTLAIAILVIAFGLYRMWLAFRGATAEPPPAGRRGLYAMGRRTHLLIGVVYLLLGGALVATTFGWNPFGGMFGPGTSELNLETAPSKAPLPPDPPPPSE
jgi:uncharacterized iron-regulated membrane protein